MLVNAFDIVTYRMSYNCIFQEAVKVCLWLFFANARLLGGNTVVRILGSTP